MKSKLLNRKRVYEGKVVSVDVDEIEEPGGVRAVREVLRHPGSVAVLAVHDDGRIVLVRQYRYPVDDEVWELPAGRLDPGESPEEAARRELVEEVGLEAGELERMSVFYTTPGFCDEVMYLYRATRLTGGTAQPEEDERIEVLEVTLEEARAMVDRGELREAKTLVAVFLEADRRRVSEPPLKALHAEAALIQLKLEEFSRLSNGVLIDSLKPGQPGALKTRPDGTVVDGHHRVKVLRDRGVDVDSLPREVIPK